MFAKPFVGQLGAGHVDGVYILAQDPSTLSACASGSGDGVIKAWDTESRSETWQAQAHETVIRGLCWTRDRRLLSCASDRTVRLFDPYTSDPTRSKPCTWQGTSAFTSLAHHSRETIFAAACDNIAIYDLTRTAAPPLQQLHWSSTSDTLRSIVFNPSETSVLAAASTDRSLTFYDLRASTPVHRTVMTLPFNSLCWNPVEPFNIVAASEDHDLHLFDMRNMSRALNLFKGHVNAVMDVSFSPTGQHLVSGSYDRSIRLWARQEGHSKDVYHTKRMQRVFSVAYSPDSAYLLSGSDDGNVRLWRARASERAGVRSVQERTRIEYNHALTRKYGHLPEVRRIARHRHLPKVIKKQTDRKNVELQALKRRRRNAMGAKRPSKPERSAAILSNES